MSETDPQSLIKDSIVVVSVYMSINIHDDDRPLCQSLVIQIHIASRMNAAFISCKLSNLYRLIPELDTDWMHPWIGLDCGEWVMQFYVPRLDGASKFV